MHGGRHEERFLSVLPHPTVNSTAQHFTKLCDTAQCTTLCATAWHYTTLHNTSWHYTTLQKNCTTLQSTAQHWMALNNTAQHYITVQNTAQHWRTPQNTILYHNVWLWPTLQNTPGRIYCVLAMIYSDMCIVMCITLVGIIIKIQQIQKLHQAAKTWTKTQCTKWQKLLQYSA